MTYLKRVNRLFIYAVLGIVGTFAVLSDFLMMTYTTAYTMGTTSVTALIVAVMLFSVPILALFAKLFVFIRPFPW